MGQIGFVFECVMEEHNNTWAGSQQVYLDCAAIDFFQRRNDFEQAQASAWENNGGAGTDDDSLKSSCHTICKCYTGSNIIDLPYPL